MNGEACNEKELYFQIIRDMETGHIKPSTEDFETQFNLGDSNEMIDNSELLTTQEWVDLINKWYANKKLLSNKEKDTSNLLESVAKQYVPTELRIHIYLMLSGGFLHLEGMPRKNDFDFDKILELGKTSEDFKELRKCIEKDVERTYFPVSEHMKVYEPHLYKRCLEIEEIARTQISDVLLAYGVQDKKIGYV